MLLVLLLVLLLGGCGGEKWPTVPLKGAITVDGTPVERGTISFAPVESNMGPDVPLPIVAGRYEGAVPKGKVKVFLQATRETGKMVTMFGKEEPEVVNVIPDRYAAGIDLDTSAGAAEHDFKLTTEAR